MTDHKSYDIGDKRYYQVPLSCGQTAALMERIEGIEMVGTSQMKVASSLFKQVHRFAPIVLIPSSTTREDFEQFLDTPGALDEAEAFFKVHLSAITAAKVIKDFFCCNDISLLLTLVQEMSELLASPEKNEKVSMSSVPPSVEEIPQNDMPSSH